MSAPASAPVVPLVSGALPEGSTVVDSSGRAFVVLRSGPLGSLMVVPVSAVRWLPAAEASVLRPA